MNKHQKIKFLLKEEMMNLLKEDVSYNLNFQGKHLRVRFDVNANPTKKGIKIQFTPSENLAANPNEARQFMSDLQIHLNQKLGPLGMNVDFDPDVPYQNVIGFTLKLGVISNMIAKTLGNKTVNQTNRPDEKQTTKIN
jgi:hypothetical protein